MSKEKKSDIIKKCLLAGLPITGIGVGIGAFCASESEELPAPNTPPASPPAIEENCDSMGAENRTDKIKVIVLNFVKNIYNCQC